MANVHDLVNRASPAQVVAECEHQTPDMCSPSLQERPPVGPRELRRAVEACIGAELERIDLGP